MLKCSSERTLRQKDPTGVKCFCIVFFATKTPYGSAALFDPPKSVHRDVLLPSRSARKSWRFRTPLVRWRCAASLCEVFVTCVSRSAGVSGHFCFGCLGRSGSWSHWWCDGSWRVGVRSVCDGVPLGGLGGEPLGLGTTLPGPGRCWLSLSVRRRCWGRRVASPGRRRLRLGRWLSAAVALVTWRLARSLHFVACRWHGRSTPEQQSSVAAGRRNGAAT